MLKGHGLTQSLRHAKTRLSLRQPLVTSPLQRQLHLLQQAVLEHLLCAQQNVKQLFPIDCRLPSHPPVLPSLRPTQLRWFLKLASDIINTHCISQGNQGNAMIQTRASTSAHVHRDKSAHMAQCVTALRCLAPPAQHTASGTVQLSTATVCVRPLLKENMGLHPHHMPGARFSAPE